MVSGHGADEKRFYFLTKFGERIVTRRVCREDVAQYRAVLGYAGSASVFVALMRFFGAGAPLDLACVAWIAAVGVGLVMLVDYAQSGYRRAPFTWSAPCLGVGLAWAFSIAERIMDVQGLLPALALMLVPLGIYGYWAVKRLVWEPFTVAFGAVAFASATAAQLMSTLAAAICFAALALLSLVFVFVLLAELDDIERGWNEQD